MSLRTAFRRRWFRPSRCARRQFEVYGRSDPSDKVGGDLVDAVQLEDGSTVAYLADIAGHGLQAGILMGMLKTAARTALLDAGSTEAHVVLPSLMDRLNRVLPDVKEPQMYATFAGFRLNPDGSIFYALAAHPPILHYRARDERASSFQQSSFRWDFCRSAAIPRKPQPRHPAICSSPSRMEFSKPRTKPTKSSGSTDCRTVIASHAAGSLPALAHAILEAARAFGKQIDDQTLLLIRRL